MEAPEGDELSTLAPNMLAAAQRASSPGETVALREYIKVLGEKPANVPAASTLPHKPRADGLQLRAGTGRRPQRRYFTIKLRAEEPAAEEAAPLDPEALKDLLVEQARAQRRALVEAALRPGTGRRPRPREFNIVLPPLCAEEDAAEAAALAEAEEAALAEAEAAALAEAEAAALADAEAAAAEAAALAEAEAAAAAEQQVLEALDAHGEEWEAEEGTLAEAQQAARLQPADATPGASLRQQQLDRQPALAEQQQQDSQRAQAKTPASSLFARYTPMEGVPERLAMLAATRGKQLPATVSRPGLAPLACTPAGFTPLEGIPERLHGLAGGARLLGLPAATRVCSNEAEAASVDSPVEGLVQQGARRRSRGSGGVPPPANAEAGFAGFAPSPGPADEQQQEQQQQLDGQQQEQREEEQQEQEWDDDDDMGGFADGGYDDYEEPPPGAGEGFPLLAEAAVQTGASLEEEEEAAAAASAGAELPVDDGGYDDAGDFGALGDDYEQPGSDADLPETSAAAAARRAHRQTRNPGARLRNELKRKSLAVDPQIGRHEVLPGVRRSARGRQEPLKWWLNEKKEFGREHLTMPTVKQVVHKVPNTPWQMVTDIKRKPAKKQRQRAPTPHDLEDALAAEAEELEQEQEEAGQQEEAADEEAQEEEVAEEAEEQPEEEEEPQPPRWSGRRQAAAAAQQQRRGRQQPARGRAAKAAAPPPRAKATKKKAAGSKRRGRR